MTGIFPNGSRRPNRNTALIAEQAVDGEKITHFKINAPIEGAFWEIFISKLVQFEERILNG